MICIKQQLISEFGDHKIATMMYALDDIDEKNISMLTNDIDDIAEKITLYEREFII